MKKILIALSATALLASCSMTRPYAVTNNTIGDKTGVSKTLIIGGASAGNTLSSGLFVTNKNFGVIEAARNGNLDKVGCVDVKTTNFLFVQKVEIIVTGE